MLQIYLHIDQQLLIYVKGEEVVGKSRVVKVIEMRFILLGRKKKLVISTFASFTTNNIEKSVIHIALGINSRARKDYQVKTSA